MKPAYSVPRTPHSPRPPFPAAAFYGGLAAFVLLALLFQFVDWDRAAAAHYFALGWPGRQWGWSDFLYRHGEPPAVVLGALAGLAFLLSFRGTRWRPLRGPGLYLFLLLLLGPGLLVNGLGKALAGRPRPSEVDGLGGLWSFLRPFHFGTPGRGLSFLSGHAANAWYFFGLAWVLPKPWARLSLLATLAFGAAMSLARVSQGAHWLSDTVLCGALLFSLAAALSPLIHWQPPRAFWRRPGLGLALGLGVLAWLSLSHVRYEDRRFITLWQQGPGQAPPLLAQQRLLAWQSAEPPTDAAVDLRLDAGDLRARFDQLQQGAELPLKLDAEFQGQGLPGSREEVLVSRLQPGERAFQVGPQSLAYRFEERLSGAWFLRRGQAELRLPLQLPVDARLQVPHGTLTIAGLPAGRRVLISRLPEGTPLPAGFTPYGGSAWLREGADPLIALDLQARSVHFE